MGCIAAALLACSLAAILSACGPPLPAEVLPIATRPDRHARPEVF
jgi:hypothetical protein